MLAETSLGHGSTALYNQGTRNKRLADVKRGAEYYKKLDHIAEAQWKTNIPKLPAVSRRTSTLPKITTSVLSEPDFNIRRSTLLNMTSTPRQSLSMMSTNERVISTNDRMMSSSESTVTAVTGYMPNSHGSLPQSLSRITHHRPFVLESPVEEEEEHLAPSENFNPWGTSHSSLDDKTKLTEEDMKPRELPFQYRDSRKLTVKPMPKKSMPMSRVAANEKDRHQRTVTNFRSRNGTIRVIKPLDPLPEIEKYQKTYKPDVFDVENIEREKTFMMLERIDKILHPNKKSPRIVLGSSEEEILSTSRSSMTITEETKENVKDLHISVNVQQQSPRKSARSPPPLSSRKESSLKIKRERSRSDKGLSTQRNRTRFNDDPFKRAPKSFSDVLQSLDISQDDSDTKCQSWIDQCLLDTSQKNSV